MFTCKQCTCDCVIPQCIFKNIFVKGQNCFTPIKGYKQPVYATVKSDLCDSLGKPIAEATLGKQKQMYQYNVQKFLLTLQPCL